MKNIPLATAGRHKAVTAKDWYSPGEIKFTRVQILWILEHAGTLREGRWPNDPIPSGYVDLPTIRKKGGKEAYFIKPIEIIAEVESRLEKCGLDGLILEAIECWDKTIASMASYLRMQDYTIRKKRKTALGYVASGPARRWHDISKRKGETYAEFKHRKKT